MEFRCFGKLSMTLAYGAIVLRMGVTARPATQTRYHSECAGRDINSTIASLGGRSSKRMR